MNPFTHSICRNEISPRIRRHSKIAEQDSRVVITKDDDFVQSHLLYGRPAKLLLISTGNIGNAELERIIRTNLFTLIREFESGSYVELGRNTIIVHG